MTEIIRHYLTGEPLVRLGDDEYGDPIYGEPSIDEDHEIYLREVTEDDLASDYHETQREYRL